MAKTPSPKVIASYVIREMFSNVGNFSAEDMKNLVDSRVSDDKREKVLEQFKKITLKFKERIQKTIDKFEGKTTASTKKAKPGSGKGPIKSAADRKVEETTAVLKKKKKKKNRD